MYYSITSGSIHDSYTVGINGVVNITKIDDPMSVTLDKHFWLVECDTGRIVKIPGHCISIAQKNK